MRLRIVPAIAAALTVIACLTPSRLPAQAAADAELSSMKAQGSIGPYRIGLNYTLRNSTELVAAHYFYDSHLQNIPLTGEARGESVDLRGSDGAAFHLHFVGNGSNGSQPLNFSNSVGLSGTWSQGARTLPVKLLFAHSTANPGARMYADVTTRSDAEFEAMVRSARAAILSGNADVTARYVHFPLRLNTRPSVTIHNAAELKAQWARIFPPPFLAKLRADVPHEMFVRDGRAMLGDGELWFDGDGLVGVNPLS